MKTSTVRTIVLELAKELIPRTLDLDFNLDPGFDGWRITLHDWKAHPSQHATEFVTEREVYLHGRTGSRGVIDLVHDKLRNLLTWITPIQFRIGTDNPRRLQRRALGVRHNPHRLRPRWGRP